MRFSVSALSGFQAGSYTLLSAGGGLSSASYRTAGTLPAGYQYSLSIAASSVALNVGAMTTANTLYWKGLLSADWTTINETLTASNWATNTAGADFAATPGAGTTAVFSVTGITGTVLTTSLQSSFSVNDLVFSNQLGSGPMNSITIASGVGANSLNIAPSSPTVGITLQPGSPSTVILTAPIVLGASQTWSVADSGKSLVVSGGISGGNNNLTKDGAGTLKILAPSSYSGTTTVSAGVLTIGDGSNVGASTGTGPTTVASGAVLNGGTSVVGSVGGNLAVQTGATFSAGNGSGSAGHGVGGMQVAGAVTWDAGSNMVFDFSATSGNQTGVEGTAGTNWDWVAITGDLNLATSGQKINLYIDSWDGSSGYGQNNNAGNVNEFDPSAPVTGDTHGGVAYTYTWKWLTANSIKIDDVGLNPLNDVNLSDQFNIVTETTDPNVFGNGVFSPGSYSLPISGGQFWVSARSGGLYINYSSVPEPSSLLLVSLAGLGLRYCRRKKKLAADENEVCSQGDAKTSGLNLPI